MTTMRALAIVLFASLPLAAITARAFFVWQDGDPAKEALPRYEADAALLDKVRRDVERPTDQIVAPESDPAGWRKAKEAAGLPALYDVAATLGRAVAAGKDTDLDRVKVVIAEVGGLLGDAKRAEIEALQPAGQTLVAALGDARKRLQTHAKWLDDRAQIAAELSRAEKALAQEDADFDAALAIVRSLKDRYTAVVAAGAANEPAESRTTTEDGVLQAVQKRAEIRRDFEQARRGEAAVQRQASLNAFLKQYGDDLLDNRDRPLLENARKLLQQADIDVLWDRANAASTADELVKALRKLETAGTTDFEAQARKLADAWLATRIKVAPDAKPFRVLEEGIIDDGGPGKRLLGVFAPKDDKWKWWIDDAQKGKPGFEKGGTMVSGGTRAAMPLKDKPSAPPVLVRLLDDYGRHRNAYLARPLGPAGDVPAGPEFAAACDELRRQADAHRDIPRVLKDPHPLQQQYDALLDTLRTTLGEAAHAAREFDAAARDAGLRDLWKP